MAFRIQNRQFLSAENNKRKNPMVEREEREGTRADEHKMHGKNTAYKITRPDFWLN